AREQRRGQSLGDTGRFSESMEQHGMENRLLAGAIPGALGQDQSIGPHLVRRLKSDVKTMISMFGPIGCQAGRTADAADGLPCSRASTRKCVRSARQQTRKKISVRLPSAAPNGMPEEVRP